MKINRTQKNKANQHAVERYIRTPLPALSKYKYIVDRSRKVISGDLKVGETIIVTKDQASLDTSMGALSRSTNRSISRYFISAEDLANPGNEPSLVLTDRPDQASQ
jgi:hypothetical protein